MGHMLVVILHDLHCLPELLKTWRKIGVPGVTLMHSMGGFQAETWFEKIGLGAIGRLFQQDEMQQRMLISVINDADLLEKAISEADRIVRGFDRPHSGILFSIPVSHTLGIRKRGSTEFLLEQPTISPDEWTKLRVERNTKVVEIAKLMDLKPIIVQADMPLEEVVREMMKKPHVQVACVINLEGRLIGLIDLKRLTDSFFFAIFPEEYISESTDVDKVMDFAHLTHERLAEDLMYEAVWVKMDDTLEHAFRLMHENKLLGLPVVDDHYHPVGCITSLEIMGICLPCFDQDGGVCE